VIHPRAVRFTLLATLLGTLIATSGCEKANDVPRLQDEARATAKAYQERFDELSRRAERISKRGNTLRADAAHSADAQRVYREAVTTLEDNRRILQGLPTRIQAGATPEDPDALPKLIDSVRERLEHSVIQINADLDAVESWIDIATRQQGSRSTPPPAPAAPSPAGSTVPAGGPQPTGSDAATR
jgi:DNA polymerase III alpha subunit